MSLGSSNQPFIESNAPPSGGRLVASDGRALPLAETKLDADACAGRARVTVSQRFTNAHAEPLTVTYHLPLPADGAVAGFSFVVDGERVVGRIESRANARAVFEEAVAEGRTAALLEQDRSSVFRQELGNVPPGKDVLVEVIVDQPLAWLSEGAWEWRFPCVIAPRYLGEQHRVPDADRLVVDVLDEPAGGSSPDLELSLTVRDRLHSDARPTSPSHAVAPRAAEDAWRITLAVDERAQLDRDLVVQWAVAAAAPGIRLDAGRARSPEAAERAFGILTVVPPTIESGWPVVRRDLVVLLDISGSMQGAPLEQAKRVVSGLLRGLSAQDSIELLAFGSRVTRFAAKPEFVTETVRERGLAWVDALRAGGGTEMRHGVAQAIDAVREGAQRQVLLITDGLIGFETEVIADILRRLPPASRVHTLGVGSAVNRSLTAPAARAGRGSEHVVGVDEDVEPVLSRLLRKLEAPVITNLRIEGTGLRAVAREGLPDVHASSPVSVPVELDPDGGKLVLEGATASGPWRAEVDVLYPDAAVEMAGSALATAFARERVEDLEMRRAAGDPGGPIDATIEQLGLAFGISTRLTSWVAVDERPSVDPSKPTRRIQQPQALPHGMSVEGLGLRPVAFAASPYTMRTRMSVGTLAAAAPPFAPSAPPSAPARGGGGGAAGWLRDKRRVGPGAKPPAPTLVRELSGKIVVTRADRLVVAVTLEAELDWQRPNAVSVELADGTTLELGVDERTTASGSLLRGHVLRLWLPLMASLASQPVALVAGALRITLSR